MEKERQPGGKLMKKPGAALKKPLGIAELLQKNFPFEPTPSQKVLFEKMQTWLEQEAESHPVFILKGYAGTGKTSFLTTLIKLLPRLQLSAQWMAPTGRASKVMSGYTRKKAFTIHKRIFRFELDSLGYPVMKRQKNNATKTIFVVDEASMVGNQLEFGNKGILEELMAFVFEGRQNRLLFIGDTAQLPPVGTQLSPALNAEEIKIRFGIQALEHELDDVVRQELHSGLLQNATQLREIIRGRQSDFYFQTQGFQDIFRMKAAKVQEGLQFAYDKYGMENTLVITRTNKQALHYNRMIRHHILGREEEIEQGDWLMIVKNNYSVLETDSKAGFLANGDLATVKRVGRYLETGGLRLVKLELQLADDDEAEEIDCLATADLLYAETPQMPEDKLRPFQEAILQEWEEEEPNLKKRWARLKSDPRANPLQIKFGYALTCHKAQGGQWDAIFVDHGWLKPGELDQEFFRWLYTAITRAKKQVFLVEPDSRLLAPA